MPCVILEETAYPDIASVYDHTPDIVAMPKTTFTQMVVLLAIRGQRTQALSSCFQSVKGTVDEVSVDGLAP